MDLHLVRSRHDYIDAIHALIWSIHPRRSDAEDSAAIDRARFGWPQSYPCFIEVADVYIDDDTRPYWSKSVTFHSPAELQQQHDELAQYLAQL